MKYLILLLLLPAALWAQSTFGGYTGATCGSSPVCTLTVSRNVNVQASFLGSSNPITTFLANNTSACTTQGYCNAPFNGMVNTVDAGAQTATVNPIPGNVSTVDLHGLLPAGTKVIVHSTDWFVQGTSGDHIQTHYNSNDVNTVKAQDNDMIARHFDGRVIDWYSQFNSTVDGATQKIRDDLAARCGGPQNCPLEFAIVEDQGAITHSQGSRAACAVTDATCMQTSLLQDMCYINANYAGSNAYIKLNSSNLWQAASSPLVGFFPPSSTSAWNTAVANVKAILNVSGWAATNCPAGQQQNNGAFRTYDSNTTNVAESQYNGGASWVGTSSWSTTNQFLIDGSGNYHETLYQSCNSSPSQVCIGSAKKGFNDWPTPPFASWGTNRVTAQECGQTWAQSIAKAKSTFTGSNLMLQLVTWNDYEEGTEIESGIDNCGRMNTPTIQSSHLLFWSMTTQDATYAPLSNGLVSNGTIDHFAVIRCSITDTSCVDVSDQPATVRGLDLTLVNIPTGTWHIWVEAVGLNSIINQLSPSPVTYTH